VDNSLIRILQPVFDYHEGQYEGQTLRGFKLGIAGLLLAAAVPICALLWVGIHG
jgi:hypothetical protein